MHSEMVGYVIHKPVKNLLFKAALKGKWINIG